MVPVSFGDRVKASPGQKPWYSSSFGDRICEQNQENIHLVHHQLETVQ